MRQPISVAEEPATLLTLSDIIALIRQEKRLNNFPRLKTTIPYQGGCEAKPLGLQSAEISKVLTVGMATPRLRFLESMGRHSDDTDHCLKELSKSLTDWVYIWSANVKLGRVRDWTHLVSQFNSKFFYAEARSTHVELILDILKQRS